MKNYYKIFGVMSTCKKEEISKIYKTYKSFGVLTDDINEAYEVLMDDKKRAEYDKKHIEGKNSELDKKEQSAKSANTNDTVIDTDSKKTNKSIGKVLLAITVVIVCIISLAYSGLNKNETYNSNTTTNIDNIASNETANSKDDEDSSDSYVSKNEEAVENDYIELWNQEGYVDMWNSIPENEVYAGIINSQALNIRIGPDKKHALLGTQTIDDISIVYGKYNGWYDIYIEGENYTGFGWVHSNYLDVYLYNIDTEEWTEYSVKK